MKAAHFKYHVNDSDWNTLAQRKTIAHMRTFKAYPGKWTWKGISDRSPRYYYLSRVDHVRKIRNKKQRMDIGKYSFVCGTIINWWQLPAEVLSTFARKPMTFRKGVRNAVINR